MRKQEEKARDKGQSEELRLLQGKKHTKKLEEIKKLFEYRQQKYAEKTRK